MPHVLVVEDDPATQRLLMKELTARQLEVTVANDGLDGLMKLETLKPDLILCDMTMPNLDGLSFVKALKANERTRAVPVIFLTANNDPRNVIDGINVGARYYVSKPFDIADLVGKIERVLADGSRRGR